MRSVLDAVVTLGGLALQAEDCALRAAVQARGEYGGLVRMRNERHHHFIIWRAILPIWHAEIERDDGTDIVVMTEQGKCHFELKSWWDEQPPDLRHDVRKLSRKERGFMLVTSVNPIDAADESFCILLSRSEGLDSSTRKDFRFRSVREDGQPVEFWIAGWALKPEPITAR